MRARRIDKDNARENEGDFIDKNNYGTKSTRKIEKITP
jgi:hypothetical protein